MRAIFGRWGRGFDFALGGAGCHNLKDLAEFFLVYREQERGGESFSRCGAPRGGRSQKRDLAEDGVFCEHRQKRVLQERL